MALTKAGWKKRVRIAGVLLLLLAALGAGGVWLAGWLGGPQVTVGPNAGSVAALRADGYAAPQDMRAAYLRPGKDFLADSEATEQIEALLNTAAAYGLNTLFVPVQMEQGSICAQTTVLPCAGEDLFGYIVEAAHARGMLVYALIQLAGTEERMLDVMQPDDLVMLETLAQEVTRHYEIDGLVADRCLYPDGTGTRPTYLQRGDGSGYASYRRQCMSAALSRVFAAAKQVRPNLTTGAVLDAVYDWEELSPDDAAAGREGSYAAGADTLSWVQEGAADFFVLRADTASENPASSFEKVVDWWIGQAACRETTLYLCHSADRLDEGQAQKILAHMQQQTSRVVQGSVLSALGPVCTDQTGAGRAVLDFIANQAAEDSGLVLTSPSRPVVTLYENTLLLAGQSDPAHPLYLNGMEVERDERGAFWVPLSLQEGQQQWILAHKGEKVVLDLTCQGALMREVAPAGGFSVPAGVALEVGVIAQENCKVTAQLAGRKITLQPAEETTSVQGGLVLYRGTFRLPRGKSVPQELGQVRFFAACGQQHQIQEGGNITLRSKPQPGQKAELGEFTFDESLELGRWGYVAQVQSDQAETFDAGRLDDRSRPTNAYLPQGTIDYCSPEDLVLVQGSDVLKYRQLQYGKRVYSSTVNSMGEKSDYLKFYYRQIPTQNRLSVAHTRRTERHTFLTLNTMWKAPFTVTLAPQSYHDPYPAKGAPDYAVEETTYEYLDIQFAYSVSAQGVVDLSDDPVFKAGEWRRNTDGTFTLRLYLRQPGAFYGWGCEYNEQGQLVFRFLHPAQITEASNALGADLSGVVILLDAGHGGANPGATAQAGEMVYCEDEMNFALAKRLEERLEECGAQVLQTRDGDMDLLLYDRTRKARIVQPELFVSLHRNASTSTKSSGFECFYFQPYAQSLAKKMCARASPLFSGDRGAKCVPPMYVTRISDCPSILVECGFLSNPQELKRITQEGYDQQIADALAAGIVDYFCSIQSNK